MVFLPSAGPALTTCAAFFLYNADLASFPSLSSMATCFMPTSSSMGIKSRIRLVWCTSVDSPLMKGNQTTTKRKRSATMKSVKMARRVSWLEETLVWIEDCRVLTKFSMCVEMMNL